MHPLLLPLNPRPTVDPPMTNPHDPNGLRRPRPDPTNSQTASFRFSRLFERNLSRPVLGKGKGSPSLLLICLMPFLQASSFELSALHDDCSVSSSPKVLFPLPQESTQRELSESALIEAFRGFCRKLEGKKRERERQRDQRDCCVCAAATAVAASTCREGEVMVNFRVDSVSLSCEYPEFRWL